MTTKTIDIPGYEGRSVRVSAGATIRVTDIEGTQIGDLFVLRAEDPDEVFSPAMTRLVHFRQFPAIGEHFFSSRRRPMLRLLADTSPGRHDMAFAPCDPEFYRTLVNDAAHPNCRDNAVAALAELGVVDRLPPDPINLFQSSRPDDDGGFIIEPSPSAPGDYVEFEAEVDLLIALTACSADIEIDGVDVIGGRSTPLRLATAYP